MPVRIRLRRVGQKKQPSYRVVVADARSPRDGRFVETIGHYNPLTDPPTTTIDEERARLWLSRGAQPTEAVARILYKHGVIANPPWQSTAESDEAVKEPATAE